jgi:hypothetical protein
MQETYHHIGTVVFEHKYYKSNLFESLDISLAEGTSKLLRDLNIIIKPFTGGFHLLASNPELFDTYDDEAALQLYLNTTDSLFINYTDLPEFNLQNSLFCFNNLKPSALNGSNSFLLHTNDFVGEHDLAELIGSQMDISAFNAIRNVKVSDVFGNELYSQFISDSSLTNQNLDLHNLPEGIINVSVDDGEEKRFYYSPQRVWKKPLAVFELYLGTLFSQYKNKGKCEYHLRFNNRRSIWKYFLVSPVYKKFDKLSIINTDKEQVFNAPQKEFVQSDTEALVFESKNTIPITEQWKPTFQLIDDFDLNLKTGKVILKNLPSASPEQIFYSGTKSGGTIYSHIYI